MLLAILARPVTWLYDDAGEFSEVAHAHFYDAGGFLR